MPRRRQRPSVIRGDLTEILTMFVAAAVLAWALTGIARWYALRRGVLDVPNDRSAHVLPIPRGGGLAIVSVVSAGILFLHVRGSIAPALATATLGGSLLIAVVGWLDDRRGLKASLRVIAHFLAAVWAVAWLGGLPGIRLGAAHLSLGIAGSVLAVLAIVWLINLYNFMDGIDGIAGVNALTVAGFGAFFLARGGSVGLASIAVLIAGASLGFLIWNWSPARIFLGDVGSGTLGFYFGVLAVESEKSTTVPFTVWMLLLGVFLVDATTTLVRRMLRGERWYVAHNSHAYQRAVRAGYSHAAVSLAVAVINIAVGLAAVAALVSPPRALWMGLAVVAFLVGVYLGVERLEPMRRLAPASANIDDSVS